MKSDNAQELHIGFTGTREGMNRRQSDRLMAYLQGIVVEFRDKDLFFHHGDCRGADDQACNIARELGFKIACHPPDNPAYRAFKAADILYPARGYLARNRDIVDASDVLVATPDTCEERLRSGTWSTIRYCRKVGKGVEIILPK